MTAPSLDQQIAEIKREIAIRKNVYPKWVAADKMRQAESDLAIASLTAALHTVMAVKRLRATMVEHYLIDASFTPDQGGRVTSVCSCSWKSPYITDSELVALEAYIDHVFERSKAAEGAPAS